MSSGQAHHLARKKEIWASFWMSVAITFALLGVKWLIEKTDFGKQIESMSYDLLQHHLSSVVSAKDLSVVVLDISGIPMVPSKGLQGGLITDRSQLADIVKSLMTTNGAPKAIGLDIDFSPDANGYADPADPQLLDSFLEDNATTPIRVGVNGSLVLGPEKWLGDPKYIGLATCIVVPNPEQHQSARSMPQWLDVNYSSAPYGGVVERCPSMGVALAQVAIPDVPPWAGPFAESVSEKNEGPLANSEFLVDYSPLDAMSAAPPQISTPADAANIATRLGLDKKIVLLGRTQNTTDLFIVPDRPDRTYAGVFLHASAAYTLSQKRPLYRLKELGRIVFDILFSGAIFGSLLWSRLSRHKQGMEEFMGHRFAGLLGFGVALILIVGAISLVRVTHLMWDDFILVAVVLMAHSSIERTTEEVGGWLKSCWNSGRGVPASSAPSQPDGEK